MAPRFTTVGVDDILPDDVMEAISVTGGGTERKYVDVDPVDPRLPDEVGMATFPDVDARWFGLDTAAAGATNVSAIHAALSFAAGKRVTLPPGRFDLDGTISGEVSLPTDGHISGSGRGVTVLVQNKANSSAIDGDSISNWSVSDLSIDKTGTPTAAPGIHIRGDGDDGNISRVSILNGGLYISGGEPAWDTGTPPTVRGRQRNLVIDSVWADGSIEYGLKLQSVSRVDVIGVHVQNSAQDGMKFQYCCDDVSIIGGSSINNGQEGLDAFNGGVNFNILGLKCEGNAQNGITLKSDENVLSLSDQQPAGRACVVGVICRNNAGSGLTLNRSGNTDDPSLPLMSHVVVEGGQFNDNDGYGILLRARNCTLLGPMVRRNGLHGLFIDDGAMDCDIVSPQVSGNGRVAGTWDGITLGGTRNRVIGGFSNGKDDATIDSIKADADYAALTATQRWGLLIRSGSTDCEAHNVTTLYNLTGGQTSSAASGMIRSRDTIDIRDSATARTIVATVNGLTGKLTAGTAVDYMKVNGTGAFSLGHASLQSCSLLGPASGWLCFPKFHAQGEVEIEGAINHDGTTVGFNGATPTAKSTGWGAPTGTATKTTFDTATVTLPQLAERLKALVDYLTLRGDIGA